MSTATLSYDGSNQRVDNLKRKKRFKKFKFQTVPTYTRYDSDSESDSSSTETSASDSGEAPKSRRKRQADERLRAESHFTRRDGIVYIQDGLWNHYIKHAVNCHLYIGIWVDNLPSQQHPTYPLQTGQQSVSAGDNEKDSAIEHLSGLQRRSGRLPSKIRIMNDLLEQRLANCCGLVGIGADQVAPYWIFIYNAERIRDSLKQEEELFEISKKYFPNHPAVLRTGAWLPPEFADGEYDSLDMNPVNAENVERRRVLVDGLRAVVQLLDTDLAELVITHRSLRDDPHTGVKVPFAHLWYLFYPGCQVVSTRPHVQGFSCLDTTGGREYVNPNDRIWKLHTSDFLVRCISLDFDGKRFGPKYSTISIPPYEGLMAVTDLPVYPVSCADTGLKRSLEERGIKFEQLTTNARHRRYKGFSLIQEPTFDTLEEIDGHIVIDFQSAYRSAEPKIPLPVFGPHSQLPGMNAAHVAGGEGLPGLALPGIPPNPTPIYGGGQMPNKEPLKEPLTPPQYLSTTVDRYGTTSDNSEYLYSRWEHFVHNTTLLRFQQPGTLTNEGHFVLPIRMYGYSLLNRKWYPLHIDLIEEVQEVSPGQNDGFQKLVLPDGHKDIVRALVNSYARRFTPTKKIGPEFDVVKGKGKGLIILLHGAPGVGKTSTAECVAANAGRPLFPITCGDLGGISAKEVEQNLERFFDLAGKWGCVLLLDEADVFLAARDRGDIRQISLVSVFLRVLEYYSGILILTTNRVGSFDEAIKSRVHCALYYPPLNRRQSLEIWKMNLDTLEERNNYQGPDTVMKVRFNRKEIERYAEEHWESCTESMRWNGRQIKNAFQTAVALADWDHFQNTGGNPHPDGPLLKKSHFQTVSQASAHFDDYLMKVRGADQERARMHEIRRDDIRVHHRDTGSKKTSSKNAKGKGKKRTKPPPPPESSEEETEEEEDEDGSEGTEEESSAAASASEEEEEEEVPPPPPKKKSKKLVTRKKVTE
ncbi:hypothetical protein QBC38DRAFT_489242 [Podospora fimiseda]|uniref:AAA+ ATPase domain-containing protein n=1 Tax=Podospora fimiseda TaxID=252190 RepID=A0AAN6YQM8_9PEZI|nr:hypothetical protein QBC38DRAFT_489242 [Podospora fimiseda]